MNWLIKAAFPQLRPAVKIGPRIFVGPSHLFAEFEAMDEGWLINDGNDHYHGPNHEPYIEGFVTVDGVFLTRDESESYTGWRNSEDLPNRNEIWTEYVNRKDFFNRVNVHT